MTAETRVPGGLRVLVVADDPLVRSGLASMLAGHPDCLVVGQTASDKPSVEVLEAAMPDAVLLDPGWDTGQDTSSWLERLMDWVELDVPIAVVLADATQAAEAWTAGARGILARQASSGQMVDALRALASGLTVFEAAFASSLVSAGADADRRNAGGLTPREMEVLRLMAEGLPNKGIAHRLQITEHTVKFHVNAILGKLGAQSRTEAVVVATRHGLLTL